MYLVQSLLSNPVASVVRNVVVQPQDSVGVNPTVGASDMAVRVALLAPELAVLGLEPEVPGGTLIGLDVVLDWVRFQRSSLVQVGQGHRCEKRELKQNRKCQGNVNRKLC